MAKIKPLIIENKATKSAFNQPLSLEELSLRKDPNQIERGMCRIQFSCEYFVYPRSPRSKRIYSRAKCFDGQPFSSRYSQKKV